MIIQEDYYPSVDGVKMFVLFNYSAGYINGAGGEHFAYKFSESIKFY